MSLQPASTEVTERVASVIDACKGFEGPMLPILHGLQQEFGYVPPEALPIVAEALNISRAEAHGVMTFYHDYRTHPAGRHVLKVCRAEACQASGGDMVLMQLQAKLGIGFHQTTSDDAVTLEPVYCLGLCACAPAAMLDGQVFGRLDADLIDEIVDEVRR